MTNPIDTITNLISLPYEYEWLDFKENWFPKDEIGEYISAISTGSALSGREFDYVVWGVSDKTHEITDTTVNFDKDIDHKLLKKLSCTKSKTSIVFEVEETEIDGKKIQLLTIPSARLEIKESELMNGLL